MNDLEVPLIVRKTPEGLALRGPSFRAFVPREFLILAAIDRFGLTREQAELVVDGNLAEATVTGRGEVA